jgi:hypothetical protein
MVAELIPREDFEDRKQIFNYPHETRAQRRRAELHAHILLAGLSLQDELDKATPGLISEITRPKENQSNIYHLPQQKSKKFHLPKTEFAFRSNVARSIKALDEELGIFNTRIAPKFVQTPQQTYTKDLFKDIRQSALNDLREIGITEMPQRDLTRMLVEKARGATFKDMPAELPQPNFIKRKLQQFKNWLCTA